MPSVLVTGASRGFGRDLAGTFLRRGWTVFPLVRTPQAMAAWAGADRCFPLCADVGAAEDAIGRALEARTSALDLLVNNAGQSVPVPLTSRRARVPPLAPPPRAR